MSNQQAIVFQNQSRLVLDWAAGCGYCLELMDLNMITDLQVRWATEGYSKELQERFVTMQKYLEEKYGSGGK